MAQKQEEYYTDPVTGARWVKKPKMPEGYVVRLIQHGGRVHFGIPRKLTDRLNLVRGQLVMITVEGTHLRIERLRVVAREKKERGS